MLNTAMSEIGHGLQHPHKPKIITPRIKGSSDIKLKHFRVSCPATSCKACRDQARRRFTGQEVEIPPSQRSVFMRRRAEVIIAQCA